MSQFMFVITVYIEYLRCETFKNNAMFMQQAQNLTNNQQARHVIRIENGNYQGFKSILAFVAHRSIQHKFWV